MSESLPLYIKPWLLYRQRDVISGRIALTEMPNLLASQLRQEGQAAVEVEVVQRDDGHVVLQGQASITLELECQRCLEPIVTDFVVKMALVLVKFEHQLASVSDSDEALVCEESLSLAELVEEEFILALPMIAKHDHCEMAVKNNKRDTDENEDRQHPFADLKSLI